jgi:putative ATP-dependent endonuclease of OLD family
MHLSEIVIENFRCFGESDKRLRLPLRRGLTALVGENDSGKTAVIDALRFALGTADQEWHRLENTDFYEEDLSREIKIVCKFENLIPAEQRAFVEYLTYDTTSGNVPILYVNWTARDTGETRRGHSYRRVEIHSGKDGNGPSIAPEARALLRATYLRPLRNAEQALSAGRGSRLSQILHHTPLVKETGVTFGPSDLDSITPKTLRQLNVLGIANLIDALLENQRGIVEARKEINTRLGSLALDGDDARSSISVGGAVSDDVRLRQLLEKLDLRLGGKGRPGLGSNNLLFIACELLLLAQGDIGNRLLLIEEPEAHLHAQRQLRLMKFLQEQSEQNDIQIIVTTHSPNLASAIDLNNLVMLQNGRAFSLAEGQTKLEHSDYRFLQRFLDVTKANLFFARGVVIVEGDAESILLPTLAELIGLDFAARGVSIVNVGGVGLRRYARIFQRDDVGQNGLLDIPVACVTDMDVMPDCAPVIIGKVREGEDWPDKNRRRWRAKRDFGDEEKLLEERNKKIAKASGQNVQTFVSDEWTLEYDLVIGPKGKNDSSCGGLAEDVYVAACLAEQDEAINARKVNKSEVERTAATEFAGLRANSSVKGGKTAEEVLASHIYAKFSKGGVSKAIAAQYLAERLQDRIKKGKLTSEGLQKQLPEYLVAAIRWVTAAHNTPDSQID